MASVLKQMDPNSPQFTPSRGWHVEEERAPTANAKTPSHVRGDNNNKRKNKKKQTGPRRGDSAKSKGKERDRSAQNRNADRGNAKPRNAKNRSKQNGGASTRGKKSNRKKNTTDFEPNFEAPDMRVVTIPGHCTERLTRPYSVHDVMISPGFFCDTSDMSMFESLKREIESFPPNLLKLWHGDSHHIADDRALRGTWKRQCPTFLKVVERMESFFNMKIGATRFNFYKDGKAWKPQHHDRAAFTKNCPQNLTIAASFGAERECCFEQVSTGSRIHLPLPNGR